MEHARAKPLTDEESQSPYIASLLDLVRPKKGPEDSDEEDDY